MLYTLSLLTRQRLECRLNSLSLCPDESLLSGSSSIASHAACGSIFGFMHRQHHRTCDHGMLMRHLLQYKEDFEVLSKAAPGDFGISSRSADNQVHSQPAGGIVHVLYPQ